MDTVAELQARIERYKKIVAETGGVRAWRWQTRLERDERVLAELLAR